MVEGQGRTGVGEHHRVPKMGHRGDCEGGEGGGEKTGEEIREGAGR